jgi:hypothetical protein
MKLNKVEKIIIVVILLGLILVGGAFMFVVPSFQQIGKNNEVLAKNLQEKAELDDRLSRLNTIDADIETQKSNARKAEGGFYPDLTTYEASELAMAYLKSANLEAHEISITALATRDVNLEYFIPAEVNYELKANAAAAKNTGSDAEQEEVVEGQFTDGGKKYVITVNSTINVVITDENGNEVDPAKYSDTMKKVYKAAVCKACATGGVKQTVAFIQATYTVKGKYADYAKFIDHIYSLDRATMFGSVVYPATMTIKEDKDSETLYIGENGTIATGSEANGKETKVTDDTEIEEDLTIMFLCVEPMEGLKTLDADGTKIVVDQRPTIY